MNFLNPAVLIGLIAAAIPVLLHILNLRKLKTVEFSTLRFINELKKTQIKRLKLKQIILLILRILIIVSIVLAFSRPVIQRKLPVFQSYSKSSAVIIVDNSISMDLTDENGSRFTQAKNAANSIIEHLSDGSEISVIQMAKSDVGSSMGLTKDYKKLQKFVTDMKMNLVPANMDNALRVAESFLDNATNINKEIFIISDFQNNIFAVDTDDTLTFKNSNSAIYAIPIGMNTNTDIKNLSIDSLRMVSSIFQKNRPVEIEAVVRNHSKNNNNGIVVSLLYNNNRIAQRNIDVPANETRVVSISGVPQSKGVYDAKIEIEGDGLETDNERFFGFILPEMNKTLIVSDDTKVFRAFFTGLDEIGSFTETEIIKPNDLASYKLEDFNAIVLGDTKYNENNLLRVKKYVEAGGKALIFANDSTDDKIFSGFLDSLGFGVKSEQIFSGTDPISFTEVDKLHPIFESVFEIDGESRSKEIETPVLKKADIVSGGYHIIRFAESGFFAESSKGEGKALYLAASYKSEWGNFAMTGLFPTILYRSLVYLSASEMASQECIFGDNTMIKLPDLFSNSQTCKVIDPNDEIIYMGVMQTPNASVIMNPNVSILGNYIVYSDKDKPVAMFSQNLNPSESVINKPDEVEIENKLLSRYAENQVVTLIKNPRTISDNIIKARIGTELWKIFALLAILSALAEMIVARIGTNPEE